MASHSARIFSREQSLRCGDPDERKAIQKAAFASGVEKFARADPKVAVTSAAFDRDPFLLGTPDGTVDLRTGGLRAPDLSDRITRVTAVAPSPSASCPRFLDFLSQATGGDPELIRFLQQVSGYCLTGAIREQVLLFIYGDGGTGKSTFLRVLTSILADYAVTASMDVFTTSQFDRHPTELARMHGARLVTAIETERGRAWAESRIASLTGGDAISARFMRQDFFTFIPQFKLLCVGNHLPNLQGVDQAMRRRFRIIPFTVKPEVVNRHLAEQLQAEWPAILRWMIERCLDWQANGLIEPARVKAEGEAYFSAQDLVGQWVEARCETGQGMTETTGELFASWSGWSVSNGERPGSSKQFSQLLIRAGFVSVKNTPGHHGKRGFGGIQVKRQSNGG